MVSLIVTVSVPPWMRVVTSPVETAGLPGSAWPQGALFTGVPRASCSESQAGATRVK